jgi:hypothetical protein
MNQSKSIREMKGLGRGHIKRLKDQLSKKKT